MVNSQKIRSCRTVLTRANPVRGDRPKSSMVRGAGAPGLLPLMLMAATCLVFTACKDSGITVARVEGDVRKAIHAGATKEQVLQFLSTYQVNKHKFELEPYLDGQYVADLLEGIENGDVEIPQELGEKLKKHLKGFLRACIPNVKKVPSVASDICVTFYFDKGERVIDYKVWKSVHD
jgi:hypothetical protein